MARIYLTLLLISFGLAGCSSLSDEKPTSADEFYAKGLAYFNDEDYLEAQKMFDIIKLQYPASQFADDAQYYLAETSYKRDQYHMAAFNYQMLRRAYPTSPYRKEALFKAALCYWELSPMYQRDQDYTRQAIDAFTNYQTLYPGDSLASQAGNYIDQLRDKLGKRDYSTAVLYQKMYSPHAALIYFQSVIDNYADTKYYEPAYFGKIEALRDIMEYDKARASIELFYRIFPKGELTDKVRELESGLPKPE